MKQRLGLAIVLFCLMPALFAQQKAKQNAREDNAWFLIKFRATYLCSITLFMAILEYFKMHIVWIIYLLFLICRYPFIHRPFNELY